METLHNVVLSYMSLTQNVNQVGYGQIREALKLSWYTLFKNTKESILRRWEEVNNGVVIIPRSAENILGVYVVDECNELKPLYQDNFKNILEKPNTKKCTCNSCEEEDCLCPSVLPKLVETTVVIDGDSYTNKTITYVNKKTGSVTEVTETWVASYDKTGAFKNAQKVVKENKVCNVEMSKCGCVSNTDKNISNLEKCGCVDKSCAQYLRDKYPSVYNEFGYYKIDWEKKRIHIFDNTGRKIKISHVIVVFQSNGEDMLIPDYVRPALIALLDYTVKTYSPVFDKGTRMDAKKNYLRKKNELIRELNPIPYEVIANSDATFRRGGGGSKMFGSCGVFELDKKSYSNASSAPTVVQQIVNNTIRETVIMDTYKVLKGKVDGLEGSPIAGENTYQNDFLKGAINVEILFVNKNAETKIDNDFTHNSVDGIITRVNSWQTNDTFILPITKQS